MLTDKNTMFSEDQAITASAASTNSLDLGALGQVSYDPGTGKPQLQHRVGNGRDIGLLIQVVEDFATLTSLKIAIESDDNPAFSSAKEVIAQTVAVAELKQGFKPSFRELPIIKERYVRINYTVNGANATAGKITAGLARAVDAFN